MSRTTGNTPEKMGYVTLWRLGGLTPVQLIKRTYSGYRTSQLDARAAQFSYYAMLAMVPLLIVILACVAQLPWDGVLDSFLSAVDVGMPGNVVQLIERQITDIQQHSTWGLIAFGLLLLTVAGSRLFLTMGAALDAGYGVTQRRQIWISGAVALLATLAVFLLLLVAMILLVVGPKVAEFLLSRVEAPWVHLLLSAGVRWGVACAFMLAATSLVYWLIPSHPVRWYALSPGSVFATVGWVGATQGFRIYAENFGRFNETYGTLGGVVVLLIWLYLTGALLLLGGQINGVIHQAAEPQKQAISEGVR